ncbi:MAG: right-handed parallel beta-helix repeat-containing protein [Proteobacteria bacterium]|nr:right-handed parallel beta-helix repeat-containing protein [Pseudomonadota bacterium]
MQIHVINKTKLPTSGHHDTKNDTGLESLNILFFIFFFIPCIFGCSSPASSGKSQTAAAISGFTLENGQGISGIKVFLQGSAEKTEMTDQYGYFLFKDLPAGSYDITPVKFGYVFTPSSITIRLASTDSTENNFKGLYSGTPVKTWKKTYGGKENDALYAIVETSDGGYMAAGETFSTSPDQSDIGIIKVDCAGKEVWGKTFDINDNDIAYDICKTRHGDYIITGSAYSTVNAASDLALLRIDADGNEKWLKTYGDTGDDTGYAAVETDENEIVVAGGTSTVAGEMKIGVIKLDANGNGKWMYKKEDKGYGGVAHFIFIGSDNTIFVLGETFSYVDSLSDLILLNIAPEGQIIWAQTYIRDGDNKPLAIYQADDDTFYIAGKTISKNGLDAEIFILSADHAGTEIQSRSFNNTYDIIVDTVIPVDKTGVIVSGRANLTDAAVPDVYVLKLDVSGNILWQQSYGGKGNDQIHDMLQTSDGGFALAGESDSASSGNTDFWILKMNELGRITDGPVIQTPALISGKAGHVYQSLPLVISGGSGKYFFNITDNDSTGLLSISEDGVVNGNLPDQTGRISLTISVTDQEDNTYATSQDFYIDIVKHISGHTGGGEDYGGIVDEALCTLVADDKNGFMTALSSAAEGDILCIDTSAEIDLSGMENITIPYGVTLSGGRGTPNGKGGIEAGGLIYKNEYTSNSPLFIAEEENIRITGLRIKGPGAYYDEDYLIVDNIHYLKDEPYPSYKGSFGIASGNNTEIDNCEIYDWSYAAVYIKSGFSVRQHIHHNYIHDCKGSLGYGIEIYTGKPFIEHNLFDSLKHAISGTGLTGCGYEASYNVVQNGVTAYFKEGEGFYTIFMQAFDMHEDTVFKGMAGDWMLVYENTFFWTDGPGIKVRGTPRQSALIFNNQFYHDDIDLAVEQQNSSGNMIVEHNLVNKALDLQSAWRR